MVNGKDTIQDLINRTRAERQQLDNEIKLQRDLLQERDQIKQDQQTLSRLKEELNPTQFTKAKKFLERASQQVNAALDSPLAKNLSRAITGSRRERKKLRKAL